jgi:hypothetical protein
MVLPSLSPLRLVRRGTPLILALVGLLQPLAPVQLEPAGWIPLERGVVFSLLTGVFPCAGLVKGLAQQLGPLPFIQAEAVEVPEQFGPLLGLEPQLGKPGAYIRAGYTGSGCGEVARFRAADSGFL